MHSGYFLADHCLSREQASKAVHSIKLLYIYVLHKNEIVVIWTIFTGLLNAHGAISS